MGGSAKALSAGFDLKTMAPVLPNAKGGSVDDAINLVETGGRLMMRVYGFPKPVVVAATGHAMALGAILLMCADVRIAKREAKLKVGLNEVAIGLQLPEFGWRLAEVRLQNAKFT